MTFRKPEKSPRAQRVIDAYNAGTDGLRELARLCGTPADPLTRNAVAGIISRGRADGSITRAGTGSPIRRRNPGDYSAQAKGGATRRRNAAQPKPKKATGGGRRHAA